MINKSWEQVWRKEGKVLNKKMNVLALVSLTGLAASMTASYASNQHGAKRGAWHGTQCGRS